MHLPWICAFSLLFLPAHLPVEGEESSEHSHYFTSFLIALYIERWKCTKYGLSHTCRCLRDHPIYSFLNYSGHKLDSCRRFVKGTDYPCSFIVPSLEEKGPEMIMYLFCFVWYTNGSMYSRVMRAVASPTSGVHERRNVDDFLTLPGYTEMETGICLKNICIILHGRDQLFFLTQSYFVLDFVGRTISEITTYLCIIKVDIYRIWNNEHEIVLLYNSAFLCVFFVLYKSMLSKVCPCLL